MLEKRCSLSSSLPTISPFRSATSFNVPYHVHFSVSIQHGGGNILIPLDWPLADGNGQVGVRPFPPRTDSLFVLSQCRELLGAYEVGNERKQERVGPLCRAAAPCFVWRRHDIGTESRTVPRYVGPSPVRLEPRLHRRPGLTTVVLQDICRLHAVAPAFAESLSTSREARPMFAGTATGTACALDGVCAPGLPATWVRIRPFACLIFPSLLRE